MDPERDAGRRAAKAAALVVNIREMRAQSTRTPQDIREDATPSQQWWSALLPFTGEGGRNHLTVCGSDLRSYETTVPFNVQMYINPTQYYEPGELVAFVITGYNKSTCHATSLCPPGFAVALNIG
ncbi:hypothetical protein MRX96_022326 [Rhipicephalus microplus]